MRKMRLEAAISTANAKPRIIYDAVGLAGERPFTLTFVRGSGRTITNAERERPVSDAVATERGALIGFERNDGRVSSGDDGSAGWVSMIVRVRMRPR